MRILADENVPGDMVMGLRSLGHDVSWACHGCPGADDEAVLMRAGLEERVVLTFDKDFGELACRSGVLARSGIILVRVDLADDPAAIGVVVSVVDGRTYWAGHFSVI